MTKDRIGLALLALGFLYGIALGVFGSASYLRLLQSTESLAEVQQTVWAMDRPLFMLWGFSVPVGALLAVLGAFFYTGIRKAYFGLIAIGFLLVVLPMTMVFTRFYAPAAFGIGGSLIIVLFFALVWFWMRNTAALGPSARLAAVLQLVGYLFFVTASWFLCGEFAPLRVQAFANRGPPSPIEIMVYLVLGWLFLVLGHYAAGRAPQSTR